VKYLLDGCLGDSRGVKEREEEKGGNRRGSKSRISSRKQGRLGASVLREGETTRSANLSSYP
jgi:hypothetical protein